MAAGAAVRQRPNATRGTMGMATQQGAAQNHLQKATVATPQHKKKTKTKALLHQHQGNQDLLEDALRHSLPTVDRIAKLVLVALVAAGLTYGKAWLPALVVLSGLLVVASVWVWVLHAAFRVKKTSFSSALLVVAVASATVAVAGGGTVASQAGSVPWIDASFAYRLPASWVALLFLPSLLAWQVEPTHAKAAQKAKATTQQTPTSQESAASLAAGACFSGSAFALLCAHRRWLWFATVATPSSSLLFVAACWSSSGVLIAAVLRLMAKKYISAQLCKSAAMATSFAAFVAICTLVGHGILTRLALFMWTTDTNTKEHRKTYPSPVGLCIGLGSVALFAAITLMYHYGRRTAAKDPKHIQRAAVQRTTKPLKPISLASVRADVAQHLARWESFALLFPYLAVTWMLRLMPDTYYSFVGGVQWPLVFLQVAIWDVAATIAHMALHRVRPMWKVAHMHHHKHMNPTLFQAYSGHVFDTTLLILVPLYLSATLVHCNVWSYVAFGTIFSSYLLLIHSEMTHAWDPVLRALGFVTPKEHHVHHLHFASNMAHFFVAWDRVLGQYRWPETVKKLQCHLDHAATQDAVDDDNDHSDSSSSSSDEEEDELLSHNNDPKLKQGAYGKVQIHKTSKLGKVANLIRHPEEFFAMIRYKLGGGLPGAVKGVLPVPRGYCRKDARSGACMAASVCFHGARGQSDVHGSPDEDSDVADIQYCGVMLDAVSRSFAAVIRQLPHELALPVCVFYLALRALDTVEDDMNEDKFRQVALRVRARPQQGGFASLLEEAGVPCVGDISDEAAVRFKVGLLKRFYLWLSDDAALPAADMAGVGEAAEEELLRNFGSVLRVFRALPEEHRDVIADITKRMGEGMASYIDRDLRQGTTDQADYDNYCHIVAGLVGEGLSRQFVACGLESRAVANSLREDAAKARSESKREIFESLSYHMGLFLQKTNIIRDYLEDYVDGRAFWPQSLWQLYAPGTTKQLGSLSEECNRDAAVQCLNDLIADALSHGERSVQYLARLENAGILRFCAIPQLMAVATLAELYGNPKVFTGVVKIRRGLSCRIIMGVQGPDFVWEFFSECVAVLRSKVRAHAAAAPAAGGGDAVSTRALKALDKIDAQLALVQQRR